MSAPRTAKTETTPAPMSREELRGWLLLVLRLKRVKDVNPTKYASVIALLEMIEGTARLEALRMYRPKPQRGGAA